MSGAHPGPTRQDRHGGAPAQRGAARQPGRHAGRDGVGGGRGPAGQGAVGRDGGRAPSEHGPSCAAQLLRADLHVHTMWSGDSTTTPEELTRAIQSSGLGIVCITDHGTTRGGAALAARYSGQGADAACQVVVGEEIRTAEGEVIGLFLSETIPPAATAEGAALAVREQGGLVYVPHPFDPSRRHLTRAALDRLVEAGLVDALEVWNAKTADPRLQAEARRYAAEHDLAGGAGSDAHVPAALGAAYVEVTLTGPVGRDTLLAALRLGRVVGTSFDPPRPWEPRIVPSTARLG